MRSLLAVIGLLLVFGRAGAASSGEAVPTVRRGDRVLLTVRVGAVVAQVEAEALQDGGAGQIIRVRNLHNGRVQQGRITRAGLVEVTN
ncbi:MAG: flagella basal body P-ring formation protein FlgA [Myxococcales bacterium]|nr:flagella basal body P-ring formation protein FlgA [Myxococcota bacterium]MDW8283349.1 flagella basal body P-ring formation protein FlgA [Myxococcales bacterium]